MPSHKICSRERADGARDVKAGDRAGSARGGEGRERMGRLKNSGCRFGFRSTGLRSRVRAVGGGD